MPKESLNPTTLTKIKKNLSKNDIKNCQEDKSSINKSPKNKDNYLQLSLHNKKKGWILWENTK